MCNVSYACQKIAPIFCSIVQPLPRTGDSPPRLSAPLHVENVTAVKVDNNSVLITWSTKQRITKSDFCKIWREGTKKRESFTWSLQVLEWANWTTLSSDVEYDEIQMREYYDNDGGIDMSLNRVNCTNRSYLLTGLSPSVYYKFQIKVEKIKRQINSTDYEVPKTISKSGSYIHYFGEQS